jgi:hypothetical protein
MGRPPIGKTAMTGAERKRRHDAKRRKRRRRGLPKFVPGKGCDYDPRSQAEEPGEPYRVTRLRGYRHSVMEAIRGARENLMVVENRAEWAALDPSEITDEVVALTQSVIDAWTESLAKLHRLKRG